MKYILSCLLLLSITHSYGQEFSMDKVDSLIAARQYDSAFQLLQEQDPDNAQPEIVVKKVDMAIDYFVKSISHMMFAFKDLEEDEDIMVLRRDGADQSYNIYMLDARKVLDTLITLHPEEYKLHKTLAAYYHDVLLKYGNNWTMPAADLQEAMYKHAKIATDHGAGDAETYFSMGYYHLMNETYAEAISPLATSAELDPEKATPHYNLSIAYLYTRQADKGIPHALKSIELYKDTILKADAARVTAHLYKSTGDDENALTYFKRSNEIEPDNYYTLFNLLEQQVKMGKEDEAMQTARIFFELDPENPTIYSDLMDIYIGSAHEGSLLSLYDEKAKEHKDNIMTQGSISFFRGHYYKAIENQAKAKKAFKEAREYFKDVLPADHEVFEIIEQALKQ